MSTNTKNNNTDSQRTSATSARNGKGGDIFRKSGDTNLSAVATTPQKRSTVPQTEKDDHRNTDNANNDGGPNSITTLVLDDLDNEILHAEETDLMFKYYNMLQEKVKWETRGQHTGKFNAMINATGSYGKKSSTSTTRKTGSRKVRQSQSPPPQQQLQKKNNKISKSSTTSTALLFNDDDNTNQKRNTESIVMLPKSLLRQHNHNTIGIHPNHSHSQQKRQRPLLRLYDSTSIITTTTTNGRNSAVLHNSMEIIHDLQLVRATILLPRIYSVVKTTNGSSGDAVTERKKNELERFLYTKFWKNCMEQRRIYCMCYHPYSDNDDDVYQNVYWKHFRIHLQSANANSWRCIVIGYRAMVNDAVPFIQQLKLFTHHRNTNDNK